MYEHVRPSIMAASFRSNVMQPNIAEFVTVSTIFDATVHEITMAHIFLI